MAKRLTMLAAHDMTLQFYPIIADLEEDLKEYGGFDAALHHIHTAILEESHHGSGMKKISEEKRLVVAKEAVERYRSIHNQEVPQSEKVKIHQHIRD